MGEVVNLRMARKRKARAGREEEAKHNRAEHGVSRKQRDAAKAETIRASSALDAHRREPSADE